LKTKLVIIAVACLTFIFATSVIILSQTAPIDEKDVAFSEKDFPLEIDLAKTVYNVGEQISFNATITNKSGKDVNMLSNGKQPCAYFHNINDTTAHGEITVLVDQILKANGKVSRVFKYEPIEAGTYILDVHYSIAVNSISLANGILLRDKIDNIVIEVK
jgi:hypothetical protein